MLGQCALYYKTVRPTDQVVGEVSVLEVKVQPLLPVSGPDWPQAPWCSRAKQYFSSSISPPDSRLPPGLPAQNTSEA